MTHEQGSPDDDTVDFGVLIPRDDPAALPARETSTALEIAYPTVRAELTARSAGDVVLQGADFDGADVDARHVDESTSSTRVHPAWIGRFGSPLGAIGISPDNAHLFGVVREPEEFTGSRLGAHDTEVGTAPRLALPAVEGYVILEEAGEGGISTTFERAYGPRIPDELMALTPDQLRLKKSQTEDDLRLHAEDDTITQHIEVELRHIDRLLVHWDAVFDTWSPVKRYAHRVKDEFTSLSNTLTHLTHDVAPRTYKACISGIRKAIRGSEQYQVASRTVRTHMSAIEPLADRDDEDVELQAAVETLEAARSQRKRISPIRASFAEFLEDLLREY